MRLTEINGKVTSQLSEKLLFEIMDTKYSWKNKENETESLYDLFSIDLMHIFHIIPWLGGCILTWLQTAQIYNLHSC